MKYTDLSITNQLYWYAANSEIQALSEWVSDLIMERGAYRKASVILRVAERMQQKAIGRKK